MPYTPHLDHDPDIERAVLGVCLLQPHAYGSVSELLTDDCFYETAHRQVYQAMQQLWQQGSPIDTLSICSSLYAQGVHTLGDDSTAYYLAQLTSAVVGDAHLQHWCTLLRHMAARRLLLQLTTQGIKGTDIVAAAEDMQQRLRQVMEVRTTQQWHSASAAAMQLSQHMDEVKDKNLIGISTTFRTIDKLNGGLRPGQFIVIGARPGMGKSALAGHIAQQAALGGHHVGIISLEMPARDLFARMLSSSTHIPFADIDRNRITNPSLHTHLHRQLGRLAELPLWFSDHTQLSIHDIRARAEKLHRNHPLGLLIVDYLQLVDDTADNRYRNREQTISQISRGLKLLAMSLQIPVIALSQLNRESENRNNKRPTMADLRESGAIEQDADIIMLLHRDWRCGITTDAQGQSTEHQADLFIVKWRNGAPLDLRLRFNPHTMTFEEAA